MGSYVVALVGSMTAYRLWFHRLSHFPGPFAARITNLYHPYAYMRCRGKYFRLQKSWFEKYGDIVRTGPNELIINDPSAIPALAKASKGSWYLIGHNMQSVQLVRDIVTHSIRRRVWDKALSPKAVESYLPRIREHTALLVSALAGETNITEFLGYYAFDVMGAISYGRSFSMLEKAGKDGSDYYMKMTHKSMRILGMLGHTPWTVLLLEKLGAAGKEHIRFMKWCSEIAEERQKRGGEGDLFQVLMEAEPQNFGVHHVPLHGDSRTAVVAGSDTTASTLIALFTHLAASPEILNKLQRDFDANDTNSEYLEACISEALRLNPAVPSGVPRTTPTEGIMLDNGTRIPGGINILLPLYATMRDPRWFDSPNEFKPERWIDPNPEELARMNAAFHPFWVGRYQCAGKVLAMTQLKIVTTAVVKRYSFCLKEGLTAEKAMDGCLDTFTMEMGPVWCVFTEREKT
ncbi:cytochrome P450 [Wilcoxina mikolae CBS 423.85]|nr:cytochrome P450 [Wilcoxina mikolae CBS 423.85]